MTPIINEYNNFYFILYESKVNELNNELNKIETNTKIENSTKEMYGPYVEDWAIIMPSSAPKASVAKPKVQTNEYVAASMHIETPAKKELPTADVIPETYLG